jgi:polygalacturonase
MMLALSSVLLTGGLARAGTLSILDFGGKPAPGFNNQIAIGKAMKACDDAGGCTLTFPRVGDAVAPACPTPDCLGATTYLTSAINLTSRLRLVVPSGVQLRGTEDFAFNCGGANTSTCDDMDSPAWPVLPWPAYPSHPNRAGDAIPSKQAFIRGYNLTDVTLTGGGTIHGGGGWWWCVRMNAATPPVPGGGHSPKWCPAMVKAGKIPGLTLVPPRFLHMIGGKGIVLENLTITTSSYWTLHFQYCDNVTVRNANVFNANNGSIESPNGDGIDVDASSNVHVHSSTFDVGDDALCCKSGADWLGRDVGLPSKNVLFENIEVRNGHGLTLGSEASGGMKNITYRNIYINGLGGPQAPGRRRNPGAVGGIHFKTGRGRGGVWEDISWENIHGNYATALFGFGENHGSDYNQSLGPTNATGTPVIRNLLIKDVSLTDVMGPSTLFSLAESPIQNFSLINVSWSAHKGKQGGYGYECTGWNGTRQVKGMFATGQAVGLTPPLPRDCAFL